ncbi:MAG TPA: signal peptidase I [Candidatus Limnocylindrales bacterium]|nr:signal peptidase I [Candidatus Limnocylindrales bacterium]
MSAPGYGPAPYPAPVAKRGLSTGAIVGIVGGGVVLVLVAIAIVAAFMAVGSGTIRLKVPGVSMEPTIRAGQTVTATKVDPGKYRPKRGDIVVFTAPYGWLAGDRDQKLIKRVIGLPGERVACCDPKGQLTIDGRPLAEPYIKAGSVSAGTPFDVRVPDSRLWVMGDNRSASNDSLMQFSNSRDIAAATIPVSTVSGVVKP